MPETSYIMTNLDSQTHTASSLPASLLRQNSRSRADKRFFLMFIIFSMCPSSARLKVPNRILIIRDLGFQSLNYI